GSIFGSFINAAMYHVCLLVCGAARGGFQATYRVVCFGMGSVYMLAAVPIVGPLAALFMYFMVLTYGFKSAHDTSGGRAFFAVILPSLIGLCCLGGLLLTSAPAIMEALKNAHDH